MGALSGRAGGPDRRGRAARRSGFTLVEALVAFVVVAIGLGTLLTGIATALRSDARGAAARSTLRLAQALLAQAGVAQPLAPARGETEDGLRWTMAVTPGALDGAGPAAPSRLSPTDRGPVPVWVEVVVRAPGGTETELGVVKLAYPPKPRS